MGFWDLEFGCLVTVRDQDIWRFERILRQPTRQPICDWEFHGDKIMVRFHSAHELTAFARRCPFPYEDL